MFACCGGVGVDGGELLGAGHGAHGSGDFLANFGHADVAFGGVVVERDGEVGGEAQVVVEPVAEAAGQGAVCGGELAGSMVVGSNGHAVADEPGVVVEHGGAREHP